MQSNPKINYQLIVTSILCIMLFGSSEYYQSRVKIFGRVKYLTQLQSFEEAEALQNARIELYSTIPNFSSKLRPEPLFKTYTDPSGLFVFYTEKIKENRNYYLYVFYSNRKLTFIKILEKQGIKSYAIVDKWPVRALSYKSSLHLSADSSNNIIVLLPTVTLN